MDEVDLMHFIASLIIVILLLLYLRSMCIKVYRFYKPGCGACEASKADWHSFESMAALRMVRPIEINTTSKEDLAMYSADMMDNFVVKTVPSVWKVYADGRRYEYNGDRSATDLLKFAVGE